MMRVTQPSSALAAGPRAPGLRAPGRRARYTAVGGSVSRYDWNKTSPAGLHAMDMFLMWIKGRHVVVLLITR
jgi:hypothetical protein